MDKNVILGAVFKALMSLETKTVTETAIIAWHTYIVMVGSSRSVSCYDCCTQRCNHVCY